MINYVFPASEYQQACDALPSNKGRSSLVHSLIKSYNPSGIAFIPSSRLASHEEISVFHCEEYTQYLLADKHEEEEHEFTGSDCEYFPLLPQYCRYVAGATLEAVDRLLNGSCTTAINLDGGRHHAKMYAVI
jgi:acetoin utilization deacetylase AcuC-like enzyme